MKIYNRAAFSFGMCCACVLVFSALGIIDAAWWQLGLTAGVAARYLYGALAKAANEHADVIQKRFDETAVRLYGKRALVKIDLPGVLLGVFLCGALLVQIIFDRAAPAWACGVFSVLLVLSAACSLGLEKKVKDAVLSEETQGGTDEKSTGDH